MIRTLLFLLSLPVVLLPRQLLPPNYQKFDSSLCDSAEKSELHVARDKPALCCLTRTQSCQAGAGASAAAWAGGLHPTVRHTPPPTLFLFCTRSVPGTRAQSWVPVRLGKQLPNYLGASVWCTDSVTWSHHLLSWARETRKGVKTAKTSPNGDKER